MKNSIIISVPTMIRDAEKLQEEFEKIPKAITDVGEAMRMLSACWEGTAWETFQSEVSKSISEMMETYEALKQYLKSMESAGKQYSECEQRMYEEIRAIRI